MTGFAGSHGVSTCAGPWLMTGFERKKEELIPRWDGGGGPSSVQLPGQEQVSEDCYQCLRDRYMEFYTTLLYICFFPSPGQQWDHKQLQSKKLCNTFCKFF